MDINVCISRFEGVDEVGPVAYSSATVGHEISGTPNSMSENIAIVYARKRMGWIVEERYHNGAVAS